MIDSFSSVFVTEAKLAMTVQEPKDFMRQKELMQQVLEYVQEEFV